MSKSTIGRRSAWQQLRRHRESGMSTAEYAVGTIAACAFAAVLLAILKSGTIQGLVTSVITTAISVSL
ncbi:DUF4244 domain-containing protein [Ornithinimicrobium pratense]|uniref:DUF4244 domain-containing protein n=1 Tax=Ornithinimicrobium pratense TaxID=2593973 RepID=A0A5J6V1U4_9MICO|nr:DUF4244 domain-containing protein [Ornithinimicrobium pratense]QFG67597.1 DUF4244 domain-containing protein [Ornithinimicrobium pratense]